VESHFLKANSPDGKRAVWVKHTSLVPQSPRAASVGEVWAIAFDTDALEFPVGVKVTYPLANIAWEDRPFKITTPGAELQNGHSRGEVTSEGHTIRWDFRLEGNQQTFLPFPWPRMYRGKFPKSKTLTPYPHARVNGIVEVDGVEWALEGWPGMQGHNWGRGHADHYAWVHANLWDDGSDAWFEALTGRVAVGPVLTPWLSLGALWVEGKLHRFDGLGALFSRQGHVTPQSWSFSLPGPDGTLRGRASTSAQGMAGLHYANPDGSMTYCLNSKLAELELELLRPGHQPLRLRSTATALEVGTKDAAHGVRMIL